MKVCSALHTDPADAVYIGDSEVDIETAKNAGTATISVDWGFRSRDYLAGLHPPVIVSSAEELEEALLGDARG